MVCSVPYGEVGGAGVLHSRMAPLPKLAGGRKGGPSEFKMFLLEHLAQRRMGPLKNRLKSCHDLSWVFSGIA